MNVDFAQMLPAAIALFTIVLLYRRLRRTFGRQALRPRRMAIRIALMAVLACGLMPLAAQSAQFATMQFSCVLAGAALGWWGAKLTRYQVAEGQLYYVPHTYTGILVTLLFVGRLAYRAAETYGGNHSGAIHPSMPNLSAAPLPQSPLTVGLMCLVVGYYICYYSLVWWKSKRLSPEDIEVTGTPSAAA